VNGTLYFTISHTNVNGTPSFNNSSELWKSDGTAVGTVLVKDFHPSGAYSSSPNSLTNVNGTLFFAANDGTHGVEPWMLGPVPLPTHAARVPAFTSSMPDTLSGSTGPSPPSAKLSTDMTDLRTPARGNNASGLAANSAQVSWAAALSPTSVDVFFTTTTRNHARTLAGALAKTRMRDEWLVSPW
jgi:ELWxxDGT repeat protein